MTAGIADSQWDYLAGLVDGEGCFSPRRAKWKNGRYHYSLNLAIDMCDTILLDLCREFKAGTISYEKPNRPGWSGKLYWQIGCLQTKAMLPYLAPRLRVKRKQAELAMRFFEINGMSNKGRSREEVEALYWQIRELNRKGVRLLTDPRVHNQEGV